MAFGALYLPLLTDFPEGRGHVAAVQSILSLLGGLGSPLAGLFLDRLGPRRLFQGGAILAALGLATASQVQSLPALFFTYGILGGLGLAALGSPPTSPKVTSLPLGSRLCLWAPGSWQSGW